MSDAAETYYKLEVLATEFAQAESDRVHLAEFRKSKKALLMKDAERKSPGISAAAQEREAYAHIEYQELLEGLKDATQKALYAKFMLKQFEMRFEAWRTKESTKRAEMNIR